LINVLVVDDNVSRSEKIFESLNNRQERDYFNLDFVYSADAARVKLKRSYDLLILDVSLPRKNKGDPSAVVGLRLLDEICDVNGKYVRPSLIIGITANLNELSSYQQDFNKRVSVVLQGDSASVDWLSMLNDTILSLVEAEKRALSIDINKRLITVHGIRTNGPWQSSLKKAMSEYSSEFEYFEFKYGFFDIFTFSIPFLRRRKAKEVALRLRDTLNDGKEIETHLIAHSFGTLIVDEALKEFEGDKIKNIFLCGSPLSHRHDIDHIVRSSEMTVNECGSKDFVLVLSRVALLGLGDSGRVGFLRSNSPNFKNRYFSGGHSLYFESRFDKLFYSNFWIPSLCAGKTPEDVDERGNYLLQDFSEVAIRIFGLAKPVNYLVLFGLVLTYMW